MILIISYLHQFINTKKNYSADATFYYIFFLPITQADIVRAIADVVSARAALGEL